LSCIFQELETWLKVGGLTIAILATKPILASLATAKMMVGTEALLAEMNCASWCLAIPLVGTFQILRINCKYGYR
jgi:hypothetical protein